MDDVMDGYDNITDRLKRPGQQTMAGKRHGSKTRK
jgi:hypothetical protein